MDFRKLAEENKDFLVETRRHLHEHPELSCHEFETSKFFKKYLDEWKIPYKEAGKTSIVATIKGGLPGKVIAARGDFDALPILEKTGLSFASQNPGVMHACGHDFHGTFMLGLAKILKDLRPQIKGTVKLIFQEGEEIGAGAPEILAAGLLDDVQTIVGLHVSPAEEVGQYVLNYGIMSAHGSGVLVTFDSDGGSLSEPENSNNALLAAGGFVNNITSILNQRHSKYNQAVAVPAVVKVLEKKGGIPSKVQVAFNFRTYDLKIAKLLDDLFDKTADGVKETYDVAVDVAHRNPSTSVDNDKECTDRAVKIIEKLHGKGSVIWSKPFTGGENFSRFQQKIPGVFVHIGAAPANHPKGVYGNLHTPDVVFNEQVLVDGVEFFLNYIYDFLEEGSKN